MLVLMLLWVFILIPMLTPHIDVIVDLVDVGEANAADVDVGVDVVDDVYVDVVVDVEVDVVIVNVGLVVVD